MSHVVRRFSPAAALVAVLVPLLPPVVSAQKVPSRPSLANWADTNEAAAYYQYGFAEVGKNPTRAAAAFYWASRLNPNWADPLYAGRIARLASDPRRLHRYMEHHRGTLRNAEVQRIDSLEVRALWLDPFVHRDLDDELIRVYLTEVVMEDLRRRYGTGQAEAMRAEMEHALQGYLNNQRAVGWRAWRAYADRRFDEAAKLYAEAIKDAKYRASLRIQRARVLYAMQRFDSAQVELNEAIAEVRERDSESVFLYESKAMLEYSMGRLLLRAGRPEQAREAFARALLEDLAFHPAHLALGNMALDQRDTATALAEFQLAVESQPNELLPRLALGAALLRLRRLEESKEQFTRAIELEPYYAEVHYSLAVVLEGLGEADAALQSYAAWLARAPKADGRRAQIEARLAAR